MRFSIIIPAFNAAETLAETLESVLSQTYQEWEVVVVDDGSTDKTFQIARSFRDRDPRIQVIQQKQGGEASARNAGLNVAQNEWLLFLDSDDWISPDHLQRMAETLAANPEFDAVHCGSARVAGNGTIIVEKYLPPEGKIFPILSRRAIFPIHACVVRKSIVDKVGRFDPSLIKSPDWDLWQRVARSGARFGAVREVLSFYRMRPNAASNDGMQLLKDGLRVLRQGHAPDPRVPDPDPEYAQGMPPSEIPSKEFYLLCWCAGLLIGSGRDPSVLLDFVSAEEYKELSPIAVARCIFESVPLPSCKSPEEWKNFASEMLPACETFLTMLENQSKTPDLSKRAGAMLKGMILRDSEVWKPVIQNYQNELQLLQEASDEHERWRLHWKQIAEEREKERAHWQEIADEREKWRLHWEGLAQKAETERNEWQQIAEEREKWRIHWKTHAEEAEKTKLHWEKVAAEKDGHHSLLHDKFEHYKSAIQNFERKSWIRLGVFLGILEPPSREKTSKQLVDKKNIE